eukprot:c42994_g1_i1 orf=124-1107(-)
MYKSFILGILFLFFALAYSKGGRRQLLESGFYQQTCPLMQSTVANVVAQHLKQDITSGGSLLRLFFHDCFVEGCDASVLLLSTQNNTAERDAVPNQTLREFDIIDEIKLQLENACPGVVSCADIIAQAAREAVVQSGGPSWTVALGRRDGRKSTASDAAANIPSSQSNSQTLINSFGSKGFTIRDLVTLSGAHTFGMAHCFQVARRFYGFNNSTGIDPTLDAGYAQTLRKLCPQPINPAARVPLDPATPNAFDTQYYTDLLQNKGLFSSDTALVLDDRTKLIVQEYASNAPSFANHFAIAMLKMGKMSVLTGHEGEIRKKCSVVNSG